jgi:uncharacterized phage protein (TIGR01671 family)
MREIKFRAFQKPMKGYKTDTQMREVMQIKWYEKEGVRCLPDECQFLVPCWPFKDGSHAWVSTRCHHLMEYTGLLDKNGVEIYEGDIISGNSSFPYSEKEPMEIIWDKKRAGFFAKADFVAYDPKNLYKLSGKTLEIIGNIYSNPDLLTNNFNK